MRTIIGICLLAVIWAGVARAEQHDLRVPLKDGRLSLQQLQDSLGHVLHVPDSVLDVLPAPDGFIDIRGIGGWVAIRALDGALGDGFDVRVSDRELVIQFDPDKLPRDWDAGCDAAVRFMQVAAPDATARQNRRFGLRLPQVVDPSQPLVVLIHGLDGDAASCAALGELLLKDGHQVAYFSYPADQPLERSGELLADRLTQLRHDFPSLHVDLIALSMGGLIARQFVEGPDYRGGVDHLIMIAPPNGGSSWSPLAPLMKLIVNAVQCWSDSEWSPAWMITQGVTQAGRDLRPGSKFLAELNSHPRRAGVQYTIIAGDRPVGYRVESQALAWGAHLLGAAVPLSWVWRPLDSALQGQIERLGQRTGQSDGPVSLQSARLAGVDDLVIVPADHVALYESVQGRPPASWPVIQDRLDEHRHGG
jgi:hypothetical protein